jgi:predicted ATPase
MPKEFQNLLSIAACIGNTFTKDDLQFLSSEISDSDEVLLNLVSNGWITQLSSNEFKFFHDRLQQSSYQLKNEKEREFLHWKIGSNLLKRFQNKNEIEEHIFSIISHLNIGKSQMDKQQLLKLNLIAAEKSLHNW